MKIIESNIENLYVDELINVIFLSAMAICFVIAITLMILNSFNRKGKFIFIPLLFLFVGIPLGIRVFHLQTTDFRMEEIKAYVTDWEEVDAEGWEMTDRKGNVFTLERKLITK